MLTLILLVVLGGGVALLAVSTAERKPATARAQRRRGTDATAGDGHPGADTAAPTAGPAGSRRPRGVRAAQTAIEGSYADVAVASTLRRLLSLVGIVVTVVVVGVLIAALAGALVGAAAEIFGNTIR